jgi:hypothetical protein
LVDIDVILIPLKGFSYHNLRGKYIIAPGTTVRYYNEMQMALAQQLVCDFPYNEYVIKCNRA